MNQITIIEIEVYDKAYKLREEGMRFIPPGIAENVFDLVYKEINRLVWIGVFTCVDDQVWGGTGCGDNCIMAFENQEHCLFCLTYHYSGSHLVITVEYNEVFKSHLQYMTMLENTKFIGNTLWKKIFKKKIISPFESNEIIEDEY